MISTLYRFFQMDRRRIRNSIVPVRGVESGIESLEKRWMCSAAPVKYPLDVPVFHSLPGAPISLYIDLDGDFTETWAGSAHPGLTPAFDVDGDALTFIDTELLLIQHIWERVAEAYSPFNINVTTQDPGLDFAEQTMRIVVGGDGAWAGSFGGISELDSFSDPARANLSWAFIKGEVIVSPLTDALHGASESPVTVTERTVAEIIVHEAGHAFGLNHQRTFNPDGSVLSEYNGGDEFRAPHMGAGGLARRTLWWIGPAISADTLQDDLAVLTRDVNGFGYRPDEAGDTIETASPLTPSVAGQIATGVIATTDDVDVYSFAQVTFGHASIRVAVAARSAMLDASITILDEQGSVIALLDTESLGETLTVALPAGQFCVAVSSHGDYGDIGSYMLTLYADVQLPGIEQLSEPKTMRPDQVVKLRITRATDSDGQIQSVRFFLDSDRDGLFNPAFDAFLGDVTKFNRKGTGTFNLHAEAFGLGRTTVFAVPRDNQNADGTALTTIINIQPPLRLTATPKVVNDEEAIQLVAEDVMILGSTVSGVTFYHDVNGNGRIDRRIDKLVGTDGDGGDGWTTNVSTAQFRPGNHDFIVVAHAADGRVQRPGFTTVLVNAPPRISSVTITVDPEFLIRVYIATFDGLTDVESAVQMVHLYLDTNGDNELDEQDELLGTTENISEMEATLRFVPGRLLEGTYHLFAVAVDTFGGRSTPATTTVDFNSL